MNRLTSFTLISVFVCQTQTPYIHDVTGEWRHNDVTVTSIFLPWSDNVGFGDSKDIWHVKKISHQQSPLVLLWKT